MSDKKPLTDNEKFAVVCEMVLASAPEIALYDVSNREYLELYMLAYVSACITKGIDPVKFIEENQRYVDKLTEQFSANKKLIEEKFPGVFDKMNQDKSSN